MAPTSKYLEIALGDLLGDPAVKELTQALVHLAHLEDTPTAMLALLQGTLIVMRRVLIETVADPAVTARNQAIFAEMLTACGQDLRELDVPRLKELLELPMVQGPRTIQ